VTSRRAGQWPPGHNLQGALLSSEPIRTFLRIGRKFALACREPSGLRRNLSIPEHPGGALASGGGCPRFFRRTRQAVAALLVRDVALELGIAAARDNGVKFGRPRLVSPKLPTEALALKESGVAVPEIARRLNLGVLRIYRLLAEQKEREGA
jgi:hypothetical protein